MSAGLVTEPLCCGEAMVHNSWREGFECADAFFYLEDEGILGDCGELREWVRPLADFDRERYAHWRVVFVPDSCWNATLSLAGVSR